MTRDDATTPDAATDDAHQPVLLDEAIDALGVRADGCYVDATFGRGGHSRAILARLGPRGRLLAFDRDPDAARVAARLSDPRFRFERRPFADAVCALGEQGVGVDGALFDLGVSSPQLDDPSRGFSFRLDGPLDMRMDPDRGVSAAEWIASASEHELRRIIAEYGEERAAAQVARAIAKERERQAIVTTGRLAAIVAAAVRRARGARRDDVDPATRTFQAVRIHINDELGELARALACVVGVLRPGARLAVISFHSLEDRIVKTFIREQSGRGAVDPRLARLPVIPPGAVREATLREIGRLVRPSEAECRRNPRSRSARLRVAERVVGAHGAGAASHGRAPNGRREGRR